MSLNFYAVAGIFVTIVVLAGILYWNENRDRRVGVASYVVGLLTTLTWIMHEEPILGETQEPPCGTNVVPTTF